MRKFTKEEKQKIKHAMGLILDDLHELWDTNPAARVFVQTDVSCEGWATPWELVMSQKGIYLFHANSGKVKFLEKKSNQNKISRPLNYDLHYQFIKGYEKLRPRIECEIRAAFSARNNDFKEIDDVIKKYGGEAEIELQLPETMLRQEIEIERVDGKTVGVIDFGDRLIKIVTDGNIVLVEKNKPDMNSHQKKIGSK